MRQKRTAIQFFLLCFLFLFAPLSAQGKTIPSLQGRVVDDAAILSKSATQLLENILETFEAKDSTQIVVLTIGSLEGENLEEFSLKVVEKWQIGQKGSDNGALLLIAINDRKVRIEVGYGLEGSLTDLIAGRIIRDIITPQFRNGNFDQGIIDGVSAMIEAVRGEFNNSSPPSENQKGFNDFNGLLIFFLFAFFQLGRIFRGRNWIVAGIGAIIAPLLGSIFFGVGWLILLLLALAGLGIGFFAASLGRSMHSKSSSRGGTYGGSGGFSSGSFGGGGFSGGGGGFGGGGSSGGW